MKCRSLPLLPGAQQSVGLQVAALYETYARSVFGLCRLLLGNAEDAEDAAQSTFLAAHRALLRGNGPRDERAWITAIARNECRDRVRRRMHAPASVGVEALAQVPDPRAGPEDAIPDPVMEKALRGLPDRQREAVVLHDVLGLRAREVGQVLGLSLPAVEALLFRARRQLRVRLQPVAGVLSLPLGLRESLAQSIPALAGGGQPVGGAVGAGGAGLLAKLAAAPTVAKLTAMGLGVGAAVTVAAPQHQVSHRAAAPRAAARHEASPREFAVSSAAGVVVVGGAAASESRVTAAPVAIRPSPEPVRIRTRLHALKATAHRASRSVTPAAARRASRPPHAAVPRPRPSGGIRPAPVVSRPSGRPALPHPVDRVRDAPPRPTPATVAPRSTEVDETIGSAVRVPDDRAESDGDPRPVPTRGRSDRPASARGREIEADERRSSVPTPSADAREPVGREDRAGTFEAETREEAIERSRPRGGDRPGREASAAIAPAAIGALEHVAEREGGPAIEADALSSSGTPSSGSPNASGLAIVSTTPVEADSHSTEVGLAGAPAACADDPACGAGQVVSETGEDPAVAASAPSAEVEGRP